MSEEQDRIAELTAEDYKRIDIEQDARIAQLYERLELKDQELADLRAKVSQLMAESKDHDDDYY